MKKYLNNNLFYQGDANIFLPLCIVYVANFLFTLMATDGYFSWQINNYLYNQGKITYIFSYEVVMLLIAYIFVIYAITVGIFKRKKWSTFLSGTFSRIDIRARELIIIIFSVIIYVLTFLTVILKNYIQYYDILVYINDFDKVVILDIIRIISISTLTIGILAILDSIFANLYYLAGLGIFSLIYLLFLMANFSPILSYCSYTYEQVYGLRYVYNVLMEYIDHPGGEINISILQITCITIVFIAIGVILIFISKILTNKMLVENMNEGIIFDFPKKVVRFMLVTFVGIVSAPYISELINDIYFRNALGVYKLEAVIIVIVSTITYFVYKSFKKTKKDVYY